MPDSAEAVIMRVMTRPRSTRLTATAIAVAVSLVLGSTAVSLWAVVTDDRSVPATAFTAAFALAAVVVGAVVAAARPGNLVGWAMLAGAALSALGGAGADLAHHGIIGAPGSVAGVSAFAIAGSAVRSLGWYLLTLGVPLVFPDGKLLPSKRNWLPRVFLIICLAAVIDPVTDAQADLTDLGPWRNPIGLHRPWDVISGLAFVGHVPLAVIATIGIVVQLRRRYRTGSPLQRQQLRLFLVAAVLPVVAAPVVFAISYSAGPWVFGATVLPLPFAIGFAVLARGLYDLRTAANRALVWLMLSAVVAAIYALVIAGLGNRLDVRGSSWLAWLGAAAVAISFAPIRDALQGGVNRLTYGRWEQPYDVLAALGQRLEASSDVARLLTRVVDELVSLGLMDVSIHDNAGHPIAGASAAGDQAMPLTAYGRRVGTLRFTAPVDGLRGRDRRLLDDLAGHLGGVLHAHDLTSDLQTARERLVLAREEERRRLRRDLHDGLGPALAGHVLRMDVLASRVAPDVAADVYSLRDDLRATMLDVRRVVEGLRPPALDELGLTGAIEQAVHRLTTPSSVAAVLDVAVPDRLSAAAEVAAYRIVTEAVTNVVHHAHASECRISVRCSKDALVVQVSDDGQGADEGQGDGSGLSTMRERAEELGGTFSFTTGARTQVTATIPLSGTTAERIEAPV
jgi:signal transduction histidine kinase